MRRFVPFTIAAALAGCNTLTQEQLTHEVAGAVQVGMPVAKATERLAAKGFACDAKISAPALDCSRTRQSLLPTCIDRVRVKVSDAKVVSSIEVAPMVCTGF
jgi:hypothetical protein